MLAVAGTLVIAASTDLGEISLWNGTSRMFQFLSNSFECFLRHFTDAVMDRFDAHPPTGKPVTAVNIWIV